jgi:hypothetical protein
LEPEHWNSSRRRTVTSFDSIYTLQKY